MPLSHEKQLRARRGHDADIHLSASAFSRSVQIRGQAKIRLSGVRNGLFRFRFRIHNSGNTAPDVPDPDLIIRPSGEERTSNFLVWEGAYSELWFSDVLWPDFGMKELTDALIAYTKRDRRFGGLSQEKKEE